jgi:CDP-glucose 4,6-dehydratase
VEELVIQPPFWKDRRVLLTGHTGFKGSWLCLWLQTMGAHVVGYSLPPAARPNLFEAANVGKRMVSILADVRDPAALYAAVAQHRPEVVFHLAAQAEVLPSYADPVDTYATNVMGTVHLLDAVRRSAEVRAVIVVTSDKCYANSETGQAYREDDALGGADPYSSSKGCAELVSAAYRSSFFNAAEHTRHGTALATARAGNTIGGGDWSRHRLIPDAIRAFLEGRPLRVRRPGAIRPWQHVLDPLAGYLTLAERLYQQGAAFADAWNFAPAEQDAHSVEQVLNALVGFWGGSAAWTADPDSHPHEAHRLRLDSTKACETLPWQPRCSLDAGLQMTVDWYRAHARGEDMAAISRQQINHYCQAAGSALVA